MINVKRQTSKVKSQNAFREIPGGAVGVSEED
jgi:hypothetical protein